MSDELMALASKFLYIHFNFRLVLVLEIKEVSYLHHDFMAPQAYDFSLKTEPAAKR